MVACACGVVDLADDPRDTAGHGVASCSGHYVMAPARTLELLELELEILLARRRLRDRRVTPIIGRYVSESRDSRASSRRLSLVEPASNGGALVGDDLE